MGGAKAIENVMSSTPRGWPMCTMCFSNDISRSGRPGSIEARRGRLERGYGVCARRDYP